MLIGMIGESCTGKSTLADRLKAQLNAEVFTGKDYLRLAKARKPFFVFCYGLCEKFIFDISYIENVDL